MVNKITTPPTTSELIGKINELVDDKQDTLVSGTNIRTINNQSLLGSGNIDIQGGGSTFIPYGESDSAANATRKEVKISSITSLSAGQIIIVTPKITSTVADATLKLNHFTAYPILYGGAAITTSTDSITWAANYPSWFRFDGSNWVFLGHGADNNTTYSAMSVSEGTTGTSTTARVMRADRLKSIIQGTKLTGLSTSTNSAVVATDTILVGVGKLQAQVNALPTVNNATLTIQKNGTNVATFTANASSNVTANISVPTNTNELTNGAGFITSSALSGYQTTANLVTSVSSSSTDSQYPSAKLFYDTVGDIETALHTINSGSNSVNLSWYWDYDTGMYCIIQVNDETVVNANSEQPTETIIGSYAVGSEVKITFGNDELLFGKIQLYVNNVLMEEATEAVRIKTYTFILEEETIIYIVFNDDVEPV